MLTRRIGLEPIVPRYPAPARAAAPSEQGATRDEKGAGPFSTGWEQPVDRVYTPAAMILARLAGSGSRSSGCSSERKAPWAQRIAVPVAGDCERRSWKPNALREQGGRQRASREQARVGNGVAPRLCRRPSRSSVGSVRVRKHPEASISPIDASTSSRHKVSTRGGFGVMFGPKAALRGRRGGRIPVRRKPIWS